MNINHESRVWQGVVVGIALVLSTIIAAGVFSATRGSGNTLTSTGSARTTVTADQARLVLSIERTIPESQLASGYSLVDRDSATVMKFLKENGVQDDRITNGAVFSSLNYDNNQLAERKYSLRKSIEIQSGTFTKLDGTTKAETEIGDIQKITDLSKKIGALTSTGALVSIQSLEYYYSKLADLRISLLGEAVKDAQARAKAIAENAGTRVGPIQSASNGVVQVLPVNSVAVDDYGSYDTSSIEKQVMVTVRATFGVK